MDYQTQVTREIQRVMLLRCSVDMFTKLGSIGTSSDVWKICERLGVDVSGMSDRALKELTPQDLVEKLYLKEALEKKPGRPLEVKKSDASDNS